MFRSLTIAVTLAVLAAPALAQSPAVSFGAATDNRSKNASKSDQGAYVWGEAEWSADSGLYAGPAFETIDAGGSRLELSPNVGYRTERFGFEWDLNAAYKYRVDADPGYDDDAWEFTANVERSIGPAAARLQLQHSPDGTGSTEAWTWVAGRLSWALTDKLDASAEIGHRAQDNAPDYAGWNAGVSYALTDALELDVRYHATDADHFGRQYEDALVAGISVAF